MNTSMTYSDNTFLRKWHLIIYQ
ncbi:hypothetical protein, partial [uncultured Gammaproteobacteria bacterium]